ncbi:hypothetical protein, partial [Thalassospira sp.]|uniref:hypothetical protein n=1 Tax=Thalassospira sp. TaxID=1912094 RepID=UPI00257D8D17
SVDLRAITLILPSRADQTTLLQMTLFPRRESAGISIQYRIVGFMLLMKYRCPERYCNPPVRTTQKVYQKRRSLYLNC